MYQGVGSVIVGSAPGGMSSQSRLKRWLTHYIESLAAVFFATYDTLKQHLLLPAHLVPVTHLISASVAEVVCARLFLYRHLLNTLFVQGSLCDSRSHRSYKNPESNVYIW